MAGSSPIGNMVIKVDLDGSGFNRGMSGLQRQMRMINNEMNANLSAFSKTDKSINKLEATYEGLNKKQKVQSKVVEEAKQKYEELAEAKGKDNAKTQAAMANYNKELAKLNQMERQLSSLKEEIRIQSSSWTKLGNSFTNVGNNLQSIGRGIKSVGDNLTNKITKPALIAGAAMGGITAKLGFDRLIGLDSAKAKLEGLGYSTKEVGSITGQVTNAIKGGMTTMAEGTDIAAGALAAGVKEGKDLEHYIKLVGDAAVGANRPVGDMAQIFNRVQGQGKLMTQELNMVEEGMPGFAAAMAKHMGVSQEEFRKMVTAGEVSSDDFLTVMDDFAGGMAKAYSKSWSGMVQNTKAYIGIIGENLLSGVFKKSKESLEGFIKILSSPGAQKWASETGEKIGKSFEKIANTIQGVVKWFSGLDKSTQSLILKTGVFVVALGPLLKIFGSLLIGIGKLSVLFGTFSKAMGVSNSIVGGLTAAFPNLGAAITLLTGPVGWVIAGVTALGIGFVTAYKHSETFREIVNKAVSGVMNTFKAAKIALQGFFQLFKGNGQDGVITLSKILPPEVVIGLTNFADTVKRVFFQVVNAIKNFGIEIGRQLSSFWKQNGAEITQAVKQIVNIISTVFNFIWGNIIKPIMTLIWNLMKLLWPAIKALIVSVWNNIKGVIKGALDIILGTVKIFSSLFTGNWKGIWQGIKQVTSGAVKLLWNLVQLWFVGKILKVVKLFGSLLRSSISGIWKGIKLVFDKSLGSIYRGTKSSFGKLFNITKKIFINVKNFLYKTWKSIKDYIIKTATNIWTSVRTRFSNLYKSIKTIFTNIKNFSQKLWTKLKNIVIKLAQMIWNNVKKRFLNLYASIRSIFNNIFKFSRNLWTKLKNTITNLAKSLWNNIKSIFTKLWNSVKSIFNRIFNFSRNTWTKIKKSVVSLANGAKNGVVSGFKAMYDKGKSWINKLKGFITGSKEKFKSAALSLGKSAANGAIGGLNKMIGGINKISKAITDKALIKKIPKLSTGTNGAIATSTPAIVNDKGRGNGTGLNGHQELIAKRDGSLHAPVGRNVLVGLDKGDSVINGRHTQQLIRTGVIPQFHGGKNSKNKYEEIKDIMGAGVKTTGKTLEKGYHSAKEGASNAKDYLKEKGSEGIKKVKDGASWLGDKIGDVWDYVKNPKKLVEKMLGSINFGGKKANATMRMAGGAFNKLKKSFVDKVKSMFTEAEGGDGDAGWLLKHKILQTFGHYTGGLMFNGGRHYGIDFAMPTGTPIKALTAGKISQAGWVNGGGGNQVTLDEPGGKWFQWYMHMKNGGVKVKKGQKVKAGDLLGYSGSTGNSTTPHLHIQRMKGYPSNDTAVNPMSWLKSLKGGSNKSASKWRSDIIRASKAMNVNLSNGNIKDIISLIQAESNGNAGVTQHGYTDVNSGGNEARGLLQYTPKTWTGYKVKGSGNILNGYHQLKTFFNNSNWRRDLSSWKARMSRGQTGWGPSGSRRFATGGKVWDGLYHLGEEGYPEWVIPSDPSRSNDAWKLLALAANDLEKTSPKNKRPNNLPNPSNSSGGVSSTIEQKFDVLIGLVSKLVSTNEEISNKDYEPVIDKYSFENEVFKLIDKYERTKKRQGRYNPAT
jgi:tape measure domain-containing protein